MTNQRKFATRPEGVTAPRVDEATLPVLLSKIMEYHVIYQNQVYCIGTMNAQLFYAFVVSCVKHPKTLDVLLEGINVHQLDRHERWYVLLELVKQKHCKIYETGKAATKALEEKQQKSNEAKVATAKTETAA